jgi:hypothetical protein
LQKFSENFHLTAFKGARSANLKAFIQGTNLIMSGFFSGFSRLLLLGFQKVERLNRGYRKAAPQGYKQDDNKGSTDFALDAVKGHEVFSMSKGFGKNIRLWLFGKSGAFFFWWKLLGKGQGTLV